MSDETLDRLVTEVISWQRLMYFSPFKLNEPLLDKRTITQTLYEVYIAPRWRERREKMLSRRMLDDTSPCARCEY